MTSTPLFAQIYISFGSGRTSHPGPLQPAVPIALVIGMNRRLKKMSQYSRLHSFGRNGSVNIMDAQKFVRSIKVTSNIGQAYRNPRLSRRSHQNPAGESGIRGL